MRIIWILMLLCGCAVGPDYCPPSCPIPPYYYSEQLSPRLIPVRIDWTWWRTFHDAQLTNLVQETVYFNPQVWIAKGKIREARAFQRIAEASYFPMIDGTSSAIKQRISKNGPIISEIPGPVPTSIPLRLDVFTLNLDALWEIDIWGKHYRENEAAEARVGSAIEEIHGVYITLQAEVARNYMELRGFQNMLLLTEEDLDLIGQTRDLVQKRKNAGIANQIDVDRVKADYERLRATIPNIQAEILTRVYRLSILTGRLPECLKDYLLAGVMLPPNPDVVPVGLRSDLLRRRPDVRRAERELAAATADVGVAVADYFPSFSFTGSMGLQSTTLSKLFSHNSQTWSYGGLMTWPVFQGGRIVAQADVADARLMQAAWQYDNVVLNALEETESALIAYVKELETYMYLQESTMTLTKLVSVSQERYRKGLSSLTDLLDVQRQLIASRENLLNSQTTSLVKLVRLYKTLGGGW